MQSPLCNGPVIVDLYTPIRTIGAKLSHEASTLTVQFPNLPLFPRFVGDRGPMTLSHFSSRPFFVNPQSQKEPTLAIIIFYDTTIYL